MGRGRLPMKLIDQERKRNATFYKRKKGLKKKMFEFSTLCDVDACMIAYGSSSDSTPETWPENPCEVRRIIDRFEQAPKEERNKRMEDISRFLRTKNKKLEEELHQIRKENEEIESSLWSKQIVEVMDLNSVLDLELKVNSAINMISQKIDSLSHTSPVENFMAAKSVAPKESNLLSTVPNCTILAKTRTIPHLKSSIVPSIPTIPPQATVTQEGFSVSKFQDCNTSSPFQFGPTDFNVEPLSWMQGSSFACPTHEIMPIVTAKGKFPSIPTIPPQAVTEEGSSVTKFQDCNTSSPFQFGPTYFNVEPLSWMQGSSFACPTHEIMPIVAAKGEFPSIPTIPPQATVTEEGSSVSKFQDCNTSSPFQFGPTDFNVEPLSWMQGSSFACPTHEIMPIVNAKGEFPSIPTIPPQAVTEEGSSVSKFQDCNTSSPFQFGPTDFNVEPLSGMQGSSFACPTHEIGMCPTHEIMPTVTAQGEMDSKNITLVPDTDSGSFVPDPLFLLEDMDLFEYPTYDMVPMDTMDFSIALDTNAGSLPTYPMSLEEDIDLFAGPTHAS